MNIAPSMTWGLKHKLANTKAEASNYTPLARNCVQMHTRVYASIMTSHYDMQHLCTSAPHSHAHTNTHIQIRKCSHTLAYTRARLHRFQAAQVEIDLSNFKHLSNNLTRKRKVADLDWDGPRQHSYRPWIQHWKHGRR